MEEWLPSSTPEHDSTFPVVLNEMYRSLQAGASEGRQGLWSHLLWVLVPASPMCAETSARLTAQSISRGFYALMYKPCLVVPAKGTQTGLQFSPGQSSLENHLSRALGILTRSPAGPILATSVSFEKSLTVF